MDGEDKKKPNIRVIAILLCVLAVVAAMVAVAGRQLQRRVSDEIDNIREDVNSIGESRAEPEAGTQGPGNKVDITSDAPGMQDSAQDGADDIEPPNAQIDELSAWENKTIEEKLSFYYDEYGIEVPEKNLDFDRLRAEVNSDIYAWIYVPGTHIDDPVVQHPSDDSHYLDYNLDGSKGYPGGIYTEKTWNSKDFSDRMTVIYGHNMKTGQGFAALHSFEDPAFFEKNRFIYIYTEDDILVYAIFASREADSGHILAGHEWDDETWVEYLDAILGSDGAADNVVPEYDFTADDRVLTLSTCIRSKPHNRYLVQGVLLRKGCDVPAVKEGS